MPELPEVETTVRGLERAAGAAGVESTPWDIAAVALEHDIRRQDRGNGKRVRRGEPGGWIDELTTEEHAAVVEEARVGMEVAGYA